MCLSTNISRECNVDKADPTKSNGGQIFTSFQSDVTESTSWDPLGKLDSLIFSFQRQLFVLLFHRPSQRLSAFTRVADASLKFYARLIIYIYLVRTSDEAALLQKFKNNYGQNKDH